MIGSEPPFLVSMTKELSLNVGFRYVSLMHGGCFSSFHLGLQSTIVLVYYPTYVVFQPPATVLIRELGPRKFLACIALLWGATEIVDSCPPRRIPQWLIISRVSALSRSGMT